MDDQRILALYDRQLRRAAPPDGPGHRVERDGPVVRQTGPTADSWNAVVWSALDAGTADAAIARQVAYYAGLGRTVEWKLYSHDTPADLGERLVAAGFEPGAPETLMAADVHRLPAGPPAPDGITLRAVTDEAGLDLAVAVHEQAFGTSGARWREAMRAGLAERPGVYHITLAMDGDRPVSAARLELYPGTDFAGLWGGGTVPGHRGRGIYRALIAHRARIAAARGHRYLQVDASPDSRPILRRLGFIPLATTTPYLRQA
ncbi:GNAT family N-acetyltransferase [Streptomyces sp. SL13]|uniref:GNAT family N-acetyltransferase n=1 Tax=Streptantibioticus silvisoli TaxID=2705255 RepID=A0AA90KF93_9ACTN|nr:GNAT family N-acetyltransferase [Streptantibioticus silvisoli]MDI5968970.1 GNAT family N-acetyltransferase [Streptantibioticus silvisoli]